MTAIKNTGAIVYDAELAWLDKVDIVQAATGFRFTEGAAWHPQQFFLFSDTPANKIYQLSVNGEVKVYLDKSGLSDNNIAGLSDQLGSNAIAIDAHQNIYICQHGNHAIAKLDKQKKLSTLFNEYNGRPFNSPNDVIIQSDGTLYFTDPPYGLSGQVLQPDKYQPVAGIYRFKAGALSLVGTELKYPNGLFFSADEQYLYVSSNHPGDPGILRYKLNAGGDIRYDGVFLKQQADGMTLGPDGNIYLATDNGVLIVSPAGKKLGLIACPEMPSNLCWGGTRKEILMVTARSSIYFMINRIEI